MFSDVLAVHLTTLESVAGESITYQRGQLSFDLKGTIARKRPDTEETQNNATVTAKLIDWLVRPFSGAVKSSLTAPQPGDFVEAADGRRFEVKATTHNAPCWEWSDPRHTFYRIHTVEQKQE